MSDRVVEAHMEDRTFRLSARWIVPVAQPPIERGTIVVERGLIVGMSSERDATALDLGNVALIPGLVNAHTHLEFSDLTAPLLPSVPFTGWIRALVGHRRARAESAAELCARGWSESRDAGTALVGEIATDDAAFPALRAAGARGVVFRELLGIQPGAADAQVACAERHLVATTSCATNTATNTAVVADAHAADRASLRAGLSPHAPYSVHPDLFERLVALAAAHRAPLAVHLAETRSELEFLAGGTGEVRDLLESFGLWSDDLFDTPRRPLDFLRDMADLPHGLVVHGNHLDEDEREFLARHPDLTVVYCPRTHAFFGHGPHPWLELIDRGASVALGTDSRASNPDVSLFRELQFLRVNFPTVSPRKLLELGTLCGARALGMEATSGTLGPGRPADIVAVELPVESPVESSITATDIDAALLHPRARVRRVWIDGRERITP